MFLVEEDLLEEEEFRGADGSECSSNVLGLRPEKGAIFKLSSDVVLMREKMNENRRGAKYLVVQVRERIIE